jgi:hypothetical protein
MPRSGRGLPGYRSRTGLEPGLGSVAEGSYDVSSQVLRTPGGGAAGSALPRDAVLRSARGLNRAQAVEYEASCGGPKGLIACADEILKTEEFIARMSRTANIGVSVTGCLIYCLKKHFPDSLQGRWCTTLKKAAAARPAIRQAPSLKKVMERCGAPRKRGQRVASLNDLHFVQREIVAPANPA